MRGNHLPRERHPGIRRSIPASAGQPTSPNRLGVVFPVYPRECGATPAGLEPYHCNKGLSPRVRGNHCHCSRGWQENRSIPASAGQPLVACRFSRSTAVYPRECGATPCGNPRKQNNHGLSPRVRGNRLQTLLPPSQRRSIPASAGQPRKASSFATSSAVYPRECGAT